MTHPLVRALVSISLLAMPACAVEQQADDDDDGGRVEEPGGTCPWSPTGLYADATSVAIDGIASVWVDMPPRGQCSIGCTIAEVSGDGWFESTGYCQGVFHAPSHDTTKVLHAQVTEAGVTTTYELALTVGDGGSPPDDPPDDPPSTGWVVNSQFAPAASGGTVSDFSMVSNGGLHIVYKIRGGSEQPVYLSSLQSSGSWNQQKLRSDISGDPSIAVGPDNSLWFSYCSNPNVGNTRYGHVLGLVPGGGLYSGSFHQYQEIGCRGPSVAPGNTLGEVHVAHLNSDNQSRPMLRSAPDGAAFTTAGGGNIDELRGAAVRAQTASDGRVFVGLIEEVDQGNDLVSVRVLDGGAWSIVGQSGFSTITNVFDFALAPDDTPYLLFEDPSDGVVVARFEGGAWEVLTGNLGSGAPDTALAFAPNGTPHAAVLTNGGARVYAYGTSWQQLGGTVATNIAELDLAFLQTVPLVAATKTFTDEAPTLYYFE